MPSGKVPTSTGYDGGLQGVRGRSTEAELGSQITDILAAMTATLRTADASDLRADDAAEVRAALADLSAAQARRGFTPSETAGTVFALKDAVLDGLDRGDAGALTDFIAFSRFVDELALFTFETYAQARAELIVEQR